VIKDIQNNLLFKEENLIQSSFFRGNISYIVDNIEDKNSRLLKVLNKIKSSAIIYVGTRKKAKNLTKFLINNSLSVNYYHGGLPSEVRDKRQAYWTNNQTRIMVATNAFGMGIDKEDVKLVVHMDLPSTIEAYFQEAGRAGRNGKTAYAYLLANNSDISKQEDLLELKYPKIDEIVEGYQNIANYLQIAVGDFPEDPIPFNIVAFSERYKINILKVYNILKYLEKEEKVKLSDGIYSPSKVKITTTSTDLYRFQITNKLYDSFIKLLLRSHSNILNHLVVINEEKIATQLNSSVNKVREILIKLKQLDILEYQEKNNLSQLTFLQVRQDLDRLQVNKKKWEERKIYENEKLQHIVNYIKKQDICRSQLLLQYFGEMESEECRICDVCIVKYKHPKK
ncbi:MAG: recombinase RecQ, partial [Flavobacteriales bacterium]|nr:recombinase RecQ [Flavobacteriales bacterium]